MFILNYYRHHIGDFKKDTSYLTHEQRSVYLEMLWLYYDQEGPLPKDTKILAMKVQAPIPTVELLLSLYFDEDDKCWRHRRIEKELEKTYIKSEKARQSSKCRWSKEKKQTECERNANDMLPNTQDPIPKTQVYKYIRFDDFWNTLLPNRRINKKGCLDKWKKQNLDAEADKIINWLKSMNITKSWKEGFNPSPEVIINQRRWEDGDAGKPKITGRVL